MRKSSLALVFALLLATIAFQTLPAKAAWQGTHLFSLTVQGSVTAMDQLTSESQKLPVEFRARISVNVDPPNAQGDHTGRLRIADAYVHQAGERVSLPVSSAGYRIVLRAEGSHEILDNVSGLSAYGVDLNEIVTMLFPVPRSQSLSEGSTWRSEYTQTLEVDAHTLSMPMQSTFTVNEVRSSLVVVQSSLKGQASQDLNPGRLTSEQLGHGVLHIDPVTNSLIRSAVTVRSTIDRNVPVGANVPQERSLLVALITTSIERLESAPTPIPSLGAEYSDPAGRFSLRLPEGWDATPIHLDHTLTMFSNHDQTRLLYIDIAPAQAAQEPQELAEGMLDQYARFLVDFNLVTPPIEHSLGGHPAVLAEYRYRDGEQLFDESSVYTQIDGHNVALQYAVAAGHGDGDVLQMLTLLGDHFVFGPTPQGRVDSDQLFMAPSILYESEAMAFEIEVPMLWPPIQTDDASIAFVELGGAGRVTIHLESVAPTESSITLLSQWLDRLVAAGSGVKVISKAQQDALGPLSAASAVIEWGEGAEAVRQQIVAANWEGVLYVVTIEYEAAGFDARAAAFERILSGFRPRLDYALTNMNMFDAYNPPPAPEGEAPFLLIGRILHEYALDGRVMQDPAAEVRIDLSVGGQTYAAIADTDGFFYAANLPVTDGDVIYIDSVRGRLFNLPYEVNLPLTGLSLTVTGQVGFVGELIFAFDGQGVELRPESGFDPELGTSRVHQAFLSRFPDSPWSELVRADLVQRLTD